MRNYIIIFIGLLLCAFIIKDNYFTSPDNWPKPAYDFDRNPLTENKILLGRNLFYEPMLSKDYSVTCESCHSPFSAFTHIDHSLSHGIGDSIGSRNSPTLINLAWQKTFMWDGAINNLDMQALAPISHPDEMGSSINEVVDRLNLSQKYRSLFYKAFADSVATGEKTLKAISQFLLTLVSSESKYDSVMRKESVFTPKEARGYKIFKKNCSSCHTEPLFTNGKFTNNGLPIDTSLHDIGRVQITLDPSDSFKFKVPTLRNIEYSYPYMHDGRFKKLSQVIKHYTKGIQNSATLDPQLSKGLELSSAERVDLINFLLTLSDRKFVFNPEYQYPK